MYTLSLSRFSPDVYKLQLSKADSVPRYLQHKELSIVACHVP